ncbi:TPA: hypothetical protein UM524_000178 [Stenotrophomonas maltophilia]|nr:hypothetical protein [Stenotrophomonas maltophilia]
MNLKVVLLLSILATMTGGAHAATAARSLALESIRTEDGAPATRYLSSHQLTCGSSNFELTIDGPGPVRIIEIKVNGTAISEGEIAAINARAPERSWFDGLTSSCTSDRQSLTLRLSTNSGTLSIPLSFRNGVHVSH